VFDLTAIEFYWQRNRQLYHGTKHARTSGESLFNLSVINARQGLAYVVSIHVGSLLPCSERITANGVLPGLCFSIVESADSIAKPSEYEQKYALNAAAYPT